MGMPAPSTTGILPSAPHGKVEERTAPLGMAAHRDPRRFHQQKPEKHIALLAGKLVIRLGKIGHTQF
jgi:hypothetical protein